MSRGDRRRRLRKNKGIVIAHSLPRSVQPAWLDVIETKRFVILYVAWQIATVMLVLTVTGPPAINFGNAPRA
jgi:hypothetical protein